MKAYVVTTGAIFGLLTIVHIWRVVEEGPRLAKDPWFILITATSTVLCLWALRLMRRSVR